MSISPAHDRVAVLDEKGIELQMRDLDSGRILASAKGSGWRLLAWRPNAGRIAVAEGKAIRILNTFSLQIMPGEKYEWDPAVEFPGCAQPGLTMWNPQGMMAAAPCGNDVVLDQGGARLRGHTEPILGVTWSPSGRRVASVSEDNCVRVWDPQTGRSLAIGKAYQYPKAIYFSDENSIVVVDAALRQHTLRWSD
jgi:WD40 repeat protein